MSVQTDWVTVKCFWLILENDPDNLLNCVILCAWTACRAQICKTHCMEEDGSVPHYDINSCTLPWNFIVIRSQEAWTLSTPTAAPTYLERILRSNSGTGPVQYVPCEPTWPIKGKRARPWKGDWVRGEQGIVFEVLLLSETEKGTFNPVGSLRCHRQKRDALILLILSTLPWELEERREGREEKGV